MICKAEAIRFLAVWLLLVLLPPLADSFSSGAPEAQCRYMTPKHGFQPQQGKPYAYIKMGGEGRREAARQICPGNQVFVTLASDSGRFKGFFMRAEAVNELEKTAVGSFLLNDTSYGSATQYVNCHGRMQSAITHTGWVFSSNQVSAIWRPPSNFTGKIRFRATVVESYEKYWKNVVSPLLEISYGGPKCDGVNSRQKDRVVTLFGSAERPQRPVRPSLDERITQLTRRPRQRASKTTAGMAQGDVGHANITRNTRTIASTIANATEAATAITPKTKMTTTTKRTTTAMTTTTKTTTTQITTTVTSTTSTTVTTAKFAISTVSSNIETVDHSINRTRSVTVLTTAEDTTRTTESFNYDNEQDDKNNREKKAINDLKKDDDETAPSIARQKTKASTTPASNTIRKRQNEREENRNGGGRRENIKAEGKVEEDEEVKIGGLTFGGGGNNARSLNDRKKYVNTFIFIIVTFVRLF